MRNITPFHQNPLLLTWQKGILCAYRLDQRQSWSVGEAADIDLSGFRKESQCGVFREVEGEWFYFCDPTHPGVTLLNGKKLPHRLRGIRQPMPLNSGSVLRFSEEQVVMLFLCGSPAQDWHAQALSRREVAFIDRTGITAPSADKDAAVRITFLNGEYYLTAGEAEKSLRFNRGRLPDSAVLRDGDRIESEEMQIIFANDVLFYSPITQ